MDSWTCDGQDLGGQVGSLTSGGQDLGGQVAGGFMDKWWTR